MWIGANDGTWGYGVMRIEGRSVKAHRAAWTNANGPIPKGLKVLHRCDRPSCIKASHLFLGTDQDNSDDMIAKGRAFHPGHVGSKNWNAKLTEAIIPQVRAAKGTCNAVGERFGVSAMIISKVRRRILWAHVP